VWVLGHGDIFRGKFNGWQFERSLAECDDDDYNHHDAGGSKHSWLLGACSKWVSKSAISILGADFFWMDAGCIW